MAYTIRTCTINGIFVPAAVLATTVTLLGVGPAAAGGGSVFTGARYYGGGYYRIGGSFPPSAKAVLPFKGQAIAGPHGKGFEPGHGIAAPRKGHFAGGYPAHAPYHVPTYYVPASPAPRWVAGYWAQQWVPQVYAYQVWVPGYYDPYGYWVEGGYAIQTVDSGYYQPVWIEGHWAE
jgi:hypothetical protein